MTRKTVIRWMLGALLGATLAIIGTTFWQMVAVAVIVGCIEINAGIE